MKTISKIFSVLLLGAMMFTSCMKDNYDAPESMLTGRVMYNGEALQLRGNEAVQFFINMVMLNTILSMCMLIRMVCILLICLMVNIR